MRIRSDSTPPGKYPRGVHGSRIETGEKSKRDWRGFFEATKIGGKKKICIAYGEKREKGRGIAGAWIVVRGGPLERGREKEGKKGG